MWTLWNRNGGDVETRDLLENTALRVEPGRHGVALRLERGLVMVTQAGDPIDHVLMRGEAVQLPRGGLVVTLALEPARLTVEKVRAPSRTAGPRPLPLRAAR